MDPLYVVDGGVPSLDENLWYGEAYVFSSPKQNLWHQETKGARTLTFYVPLFNFEELQLCKNGLTTYKGMSDEDLKAWFVSAGGVAHTCLKRAHTEGLDREQWLLEINDKLCAFKSQEMLDALRRIVGYWLEILAFAQLRMGGKFQAAFLPEKYKSVQRYTAPSKSAATVSQAEAVHQVVLRLPMNTILDGANDQAARRQFESAVEKMYARNSDASANAEAIADLPVSMEALQVEEMKREQTLPAKRTRR
ncbi:hypothetical protein WJX72_012384 [[Myrmecia] bisecta]|uniref:Uncharacterized protein n=1 Tax=[Myrmecia] bisecta TaxID=41462 RepID=A0AAW1P4G3_9CHLO